MADQPRMAEILSGKKRYMPKTQINKQWQVLYNWL